MANAALYRQTHYRAAHEQTFPMTQRLMSTGLCWALITWGLSTPLLASEQRETPVVRAVKRAAVSVVNIHTEKPAPDRDSVFTSGKTRKINGMGTGVIIDERGYIVTNFHVIEDVDVIRCSLQDGSDQDATVVSFDREHDLAVIKLNANRTYRVSAFGTSSDLMLGESVIAIGNAFGYRHTVTTGIISALGRDVEVNEKQSYKNLIQTDASINPGNSGGPLINLDGEIVGINVAIRAGAQRIGFAIPIDDARKIVARLISTEQIDHTVHGLLGKDVKAGLNRMLVVDGTRPESPAAKSGLKSGDIVLKAGSVDVIDGADWERALLGKPVGESVEVLVRRGEKTEKLTLALVSQQQGKASLNTEIVSRANNDSSDMEKTWTVLGLRLAPLPEQQKSLVGPRYRGGMRVIHVRENSPASQNGIKADDILVGLHQWETLSPDNVSWILSQPMAEQPLKFYLIRGSETLYGHLKMALK